MAHYDDTLDDTGATDPPPLPAPKPQSAMIFGILNLVFGIGGLLASLGGLLVLVLLDTAFADNAEFQEAMAGQPPLWVQGMHTAVWVVLAVWLIVSGTKLIKLSRGCREGFIQYCIVSLIARPIVIIVALPFTLEATREQMRLQAESQPGNPFAGDTGETVMSAIVIFTVVFQLAWSVAYEIVGLFVMKRRDTVAAYEAYQARRQIA